MIAALMLSAATLPACPVDRITYRLHGAPQFEAGFARLPHPTLYTDLVFFLKTPRRTYWFTFTRSQGYGLTYLLPSPSPPHFYDDVPAPPTDPSSPQFLAFAADRSTMDLGDFAATPPTAILVPTLGRELWYDAVGLANGDRTAGQENMPTAMFEATGCAARPH